jgi:hypothetical protein
MGCGFEIAAVSGFSEIDNVQNFVDMFQFLQVWNEPNSELKKDLQNSVFRVNHNSFAVLKHSRIFGHRNEIPKYKTL